MCLRILHILKLELNSFNRVNVVIVGSIKNTYHAFYIETFNPHYRQKNIFLFSFITLIYEKTQSLNQNLGLMKCICTFSVDHSTSASRIIYYHWNTYTRLFIKGKVCLYATWTLYCTNENTIRSPWNILIYVSDIYVYARNVLDPPTNSRSRLVGQIICLRPVLEITIL